MDLKHKGITWVGNFFQKLEAVCQEVDDIVNKVSLIFIFSIKSSVLFGALTEPIFLGIIGKLCLCEVNLR